MLGQDDVKEFPSMKDLEGTISDTVMAGHQPIAAIA